MKCQTHSIAPPAHKVTHTHARARVHAHKHPSCQSRVEPHRLLLSTQSGYLPLCTVSYSNKHQQHSDPDTFLSHTHTRANTHTHSQTHLGTMHFSGVSNGQRLQSTYSFSLKEIKKRIKQQKKDRTVHIERGDFKIFFFCIRNLGEDGEIELDLRISFPKTKK